MVETYGDNVLVRRTKDSCEFFAVFFGSGYARLSRYFVPGRCDVYSFKLDAMTGHLCCHAEVRTSLRKAVHMVSHDLERPEVVDLLKRAASLPEWRGSVRSMIELLSGIGPSKSLRAVKKAYGVVMAEVRRKRAILAAHQKEGSK